MKALVKTRRGPGGLELLEVPEPQARPGWVVIAVTAAGICGTDVHILHDQHPYWPPVTLGHEFTGRIHAIGDGVEGWAEGDRVVCEPHAGACRNCHLCRRGYIQLCPEKRSPGWGIDGGLADYVAVPAHLLHRVPDGVDDRAAAVCEPTAIAVTATERVGIEPGDRVAVIGPGPIGILSAMVVRGLQASPVIIGRASSAGRLAFAESLGFETWRVDEVDLTEAALGASDGRGLDVVIDTSGAASAIAAGVRMLRRRGRLCALGVSGQPDIPFPYDEALFRAIDLVCSFSSSYTSWDRALALIEAGTVDPAPLTTRFALTSWEQAFDAVERREVVKAQLTP
jgi:L-iditol 2-dehydrogenase